MSTGNQWYEVLPHCEPGRVGGAFDGRYKDASAVGRRRHSVSGFGHAF